ncbi:MAG: hypothetical protein Q7K40_05415 [bacterium]|nr:hypothetical protein [bacterium]
MDWAQKRKVIFASGFAGVIILLAVYPIYQLFRGTPTCLDNKENGSETGIDCGGLCARACLVDIVAPRAIWAKAFPIGKETYDLGAYVENANANAGVKKAGYTIRVLDASGKVIVEKKGTTELAPGTRTLLFETGVIFSGIPASVEVAFDSKDLSNWTKATTAPSPVVTKNQNLKNTDTKPRFDAVLVNNDLVNDVVDLTLSAVIYDTERHPVAVSRTYVQSVPKASEQNIFFTWPSRFTKYARGEMCVPVGSESTETTASTTLKASSTPPVVPTLCPIESFITEIIITPRAIFAQ